MENYCPYTTWSNQSFTCYKFGGMSNIKLQNVPNSQKERPICLRSLYWRAMCCALTGPPLCISTLSRGVGLLVVQLFSELPAILTRQNKSIHCTSLDFYIIPIRGIRRRFQAQLNCQGRNCPARSFVWQKGRPMQCNALIWMLGLL